MRPAPSGQKTSSAPISLHAFQTETPQLGPMHFKYEKNFSWPKLKSKSLAIGSQHRNRPKAHGSNVVGP